MITNFKIFENEIESKFWLLELNPHTFDEEYIGACLLHINCTYSDIKYFIEVLRDKKMSIYVRPSERRSSNSQNIEYERPGHNDYSEFSYRWYINRNFKYMGKIVPVKEDFEKWELYKQVNKFNV